MRFIHLIPLILVSCLVACQKPTADLLPVKNNPGSPSVDSTANQPGSTTATQPGSATTTQPTDSVSTFKKMKISWSVNDFQEVSYDQMGRPVQYTSQYVNNQGTGHLQRVVYKLAYKTDKQLSQVELISESGRAYVQYEYNDDQVSQTRELTTDGQLLTTCQYQYAGPNRLSQVDESSLSGPAMRRTYQYDTQGNLSVLSVYAKDPALGSYALQYAIHYEDYDTQHEVESLLFHSPLLPGVTFRANNHGLKLVRDRQGRELSRERFTYVYNEAGYPIQQTRTGAGGSLTATYTY